MDVFNKGYDGQETYDSMSKPSFFDCLFRLAADEAIRELVSKGIQTAKDVKQSARNTFQKIKDDEYSKICISELTMSDCITWVKTQKSSYPQGKYFFVYVEENPMPRNENDNYSVAIALLDANKKPIPVKAVKRGLFTQDAPALNNGQDIVCLIIPTGNLDNKLIKTLNGTPSVLVQL